MSGHGYGTMNKNIVLAQGLNPLAQVVKSKKMKDEVQPLLPGNPEPLNDTYESPPPRPDLRTSPENVILHMPGPMGPGEPEVKEQRSSNDESYNPLLKRDLEHPTSNTDTMIHLLKGNIGTGILAMPDAFRNAGLVVGTVGTLLMGFICTHCMHVLVKCAHELCIRTEVPALGFADVVETTFSTGPLILRRHSRTVRYVVNTFLCVTQLGFCCVYFVFVAANLKEVIKQYVIDLDVHIYLLALLVPMILLNLVKNLKYLMPASLFASVFTVIGLGITFYYMLQNLPSTSTRASFASWSQLPLYFGTAIYAFEGIGVVLPLENNMKTPQDFGGWNGVLNTGMVIVAALYTSVGFFGYLKYGDLVKEGSITLILPASEILAQSVRVMMALAIFLSYALQFYVPVGIIWPFIQPRLQSDRARKIGEYTLRIVLVIITFGLAAAIPNLGAVISLVGAVSSSTLALIFPPLIEIITFWEKGLGKYNWILWKDVFIMIFGLLGFGFGTYASIVNIIYPHEG